MLVYWTGVYRLFFRKKAMVVLFHRVDDRIARRGDPITCSRREFQQYCDFFRRHFVVVSLSELVRKVSKGEDVSRHLAITFDDGYEDNYELAARDLLARRLPACFFIVTEFMDTDRQAPWDVDNGVRSRWMGWDEVRALKRQGFELGAHTKNHLDLGKVSGDEARDEIRGSKVRLEQEIGGSVSMFSYPFGRKNQMTEDNRQLVREAGFSCCFSAYGGTIVGRADPFYLERMAVSPWFVSPYHFGFDAMLQGPITPGPSRGGVLAEEPVVAPSQH